MAQSSGPISQGTTAERQFTDAQWRDRFGDESGVLADMDGTAYSLTLPSGSDVASVGSTGQASLATVAGFQHRIPAGAPETITIPPASGATRTDIIALRYDPTYTGLPGPVRLVRIPGTSSAIPPYDASPPGIEELPLWAITRAVGQNLSQATVQRLFPRITPMLDIPPGAALPTSSPLGSRAWQAGIEYRREIVSGNPAWVQVNPIVPVPQSCSMAGGWTVVSAPKAVMSAPRIVQLTGRISNDQSYNPTSSPALCFTLPSGFWPTAIRTILIGYYPDAPTTLLGSVATNGQVTVAHSGGVTLTAGRSHYFDNASFYLG